MSIAKVIPKSPGELEQFYLSGLDDLTSSLSNIPIRPHSQLQDVLGTGDRHLTTSENLDVTKQNALSAGMVAKTGANTWASRTITGTTGKIDVTNGDGVAGNPTVSLPATITTPLKFGGVSDYFSIEVDGSIEMVGLATVYDDLVAAVSGIVTSGPGVSTNAAEQTIDFVSTANLSDYAWTAYQLKHAWKPGSVIQPHIHWEQNSANVPNWLMRYRWQINGGIKTTAWTDFKCNTPVFTYVSGTLNQICAGVGITPPAGYNISDILQVRVFRDTGNASTRFTGADPMTGTASVTSLDCHLEFNRLGSRTEYAV
jgi:hypothetical protein